MRMFLMGLSVGAGLGLLFAPARGDELRNDLSDRAKDIAESAREEYDRLRGRASKKVDQVVNQAQRFAGSAI